jgi:hypothetical protein
MDVFQMSTPVTTIELLAYALPSVNAGGGVSLDLHAEGRIIRLTGSENMFLNLAHSLSVMRRERKPAGDRAARALLGEERIAVYRRVVARVNAGETKAAACRAEAVNASTFGNWWMRRRVREAAAHHLVKAGDAPLPKPGGALL